jgi:hypothetical protein
VKLQKSWNNLVLGAGVLMAAFAYPHLIDDFLYGIPDEFGLTNPQAQVLVGIFSALLFGLFIAVARGGRWAYLGTCFVGGFLSLAILLKHVPKMLRPEPYWSGLFSESLNWGLLITSFVLMVLSYLAWRQRTTVK